MSGPAAPGERLRAAVIQMCSGDDLETNLACARALLEQAARAGARLALLPENFPFMGADEDARRRVAEPEEDSRILRFLGETARALDMAVIGGGIPLAGDGDARVRNACPAVDREGHVVAIYDKMHLFDVDLPGETWRESASTVPGQRPVAVTLDGWRVGLSICYDLRFPELYRAHAGVEIISVAAAFTVPTGRAHWEVLLRARAIENQCYVLAAAQSGEHPGGRRTWGHSMIVDPWGRVLGCREQGEGVLVADLDRAELARVRERLPALTHRRLDGRAA